MIKENQPIQQNFLESQLDFIKQLSSQFRGNHSYRCLKQLIDNIGKLPESTREKWLQNIDGIVKALLKVTDQYRIFNSNQLPHYFVISPKEKKLYVPVGQYPPSEILFEQKEYDALITVLKNVLKHFEKLEEQRVEDPFSEWVSELDEIGYLETPKLISWVERKELARCNTLAKRFFYLSDEAETPTDKSGIPVTMGYIRLQAQAALRYTLFKKEKFSSELTNEEKQLLSGVKEIRDPMDNFLISFTLPDTQTGERVVKDMLEECKRCYKLAKRFYYVADQTKLVTDSSNVSLTMGYIRLQAHTYINYQKMLNV